MLQAMSLSERADRLIAGGNWNNGTNCGSRSRNANNYRWNTNTNISARFLADPRCLRLFYSFFTPKGEHTCGLTPWLKPNSLALLQQAEQNTKQEVGVG